MSKPTVGDHVLARLRTTTLHVDHGALGVGAIGGATVAGSGTATVTLTGSVAQIDAALAATNNVLYRSTFDFSGIDHLTIQMETLEFEDEKVHFCQVGASCFRSDIQTSLPKVL